MKLFNQFNVLPRYLTAFNYAGLNLNETPKELEKCTPEFQNFWDKECREHPTNQNCLIYCDWVIIFKFLLNKLFLKEVSLRFPSEKCVLLWFQTRWYHSVYDCLFSRYYRVGVVLRAFCLSQVYQVD